MKKVILGIQILVFAWTNLAYAADGQAPALTPAIESPAISSQIQMPEDYQLPNMHLLDSVAFYNRYKNKIGQRIDVKGYSGRFGATFGDEFKQKIFEIERINEQKIEIILTLTSTMSDARILKDRMALVGRKMVIVEIPDEIQKRILQKAEMQAAGGLKELWWDTKNKGTALLHPTKIILDSKKIIKNQFEKPKQNDVRLTAVSIGGTVLTTGILLSVGVDPALALTMAAARIAIGGPVTYYRSTIKNIFSSDILDETKVSSTGRQIFTRLLVLGLGVSEAYYAIGSEFSAQGYKMTQNLLISNNATSGLIDTAASIERSKRLSSAASYRMVLYTLMVGTVISSLSAVGAVGPTMMFEHGVFQISALQVSSMVIFGGMYLSYKFFSRHVEKIAQQDLIAAARQKYTRWFQLRAAHRERIIKEQEARVSKRKALEDAIYNIRFERQIAPACSFLFQ